MNADYQDFKILNHEVYPVRSKGSF